jgi:uncharacterized membrane protein
MKKINYLYLLAGFLICHLTSYADLKVVNNTGETVIFAIGYIENGQRISIGWFTLKQGDIKTVLTTKSLNRVYYYYAVGSGKDVWSGNDNFYVGQNSTFIIHENDVSSKKDAVVKGFKMIDLGSDNLKDYTIPLTTSLVLTRIIAPVTGGFKAITAPVGTHQAKEGQPKQPVN